MRQVLPAAIALSLTLGCDSTSPSLECDATEVERAGACVDANECVGEGEGNDCDPNAECTNVDAGFTCACRAGYDGDGFTCSNVDECTTGDDDCDENASCTDTEGGFSCACNVGYVGDGTRCGRARDAGIVISGVELLDGTGALPLMDQTLVVVGESIVELGATASVHVYPDDTVIDGAGLFAIPSVVNAHAHGTLDEGRLDTWAADGVTVVRDLGASLNAPTEWGVSGWDEWMQQILSGDAALEDRIPPHFAFRDEQSDRVESARLLVAGPCVSAIDGYPGGSLRLQINDSAVTEGDVEISPVDDARRKIEVLAAAGADQIKICIENWWNSQPWGLLTVEQVQAIVETAHSAGIPVVAHVSADEQLSKCVTDTPVDDVVHIPTDDMTEANIDAMIDRGVYLVPTLQIWHELSWICTDYGKCEESDNLDRYVLAGGKVAVGDDYAGGGGIALGMPVREMEMMQLAGLTNLETVVAATQNGAIVAGLDDRLGTLEVGKTADLVLLSADPLLDIANMGAIAYVLKSGVVIRRP